MSTKNLLFYLVIVLCQGCTDTMFTSVKKESGVLHTSLEMRPGVEPMAFFQYRGLYNIYYASDSFKIARTTSTDLLHWTYKQTSFLPGMKSILRGGFIIDSNNIAGYGTSENPPILAVLTRAEQNDPATKVSENVTPLLAVSTDGGDSWTLAANGIQLPRVLIEHPQQISILWFAAASKWIMTVALNNHVEFFSSTDLSTWAFESKLGAEFFPEDVRWNRSTLFLSADNKTWILLADIKKSGVTRTSGGTVYFAGEFDGHQFLNRSAQLHWLDYGEDVYGSLLAIASDGRRINMAWKNDRQHLSGITMLPRELDLDNVHGEFFIRVSPPRELNTVYIKELSLPATNVSFKAGNQELISGVTPPFEIFLKFNTSHIQKGSFPTRVGLSFWNDLGEHLSFGFDRFGFYYCDTSGLNTSATTPLLNSLLKMPYDHTDSTMELHIIVDSSTIECFAEGGKLVMTSSYSSRQPFNTLKLFAFNGDIEFERGRIIELGTTIDPRRVGIY